MTILVTGATGYLGTAVVERLLRCNVCTIRCLVRGGSDTARLGAMRDRTGRAMLEICVGNLTSPTDCSRVLAGVTRVVHLAASMRGAAADMYLNTAVASQHLYQAIGTSRVQRLVTMSSLSVYGLADIAPGLTVCEDMPLDPFPLRRDVYTQTKILQEQLLANSPIPGRIATVVLRAGPLYGRGGTTLTSRIGLEFTGVMLRLGGNARLPLSYVDNCADAVVRSVCDDGMPAGVYNVLDDDSPTAEEYLAAYRRAVRPIRSIRMPGLATMALARLNERLHARSQGQFPLVISRYRARNLWRGHVYSNARLKAAGWSQPIATADALRLAMGGEGLGERTSAAPAARKPDAFRPARS